MYKIWPDDQIYSLSRTLCSASAVESILIAEQSAFVVSRERIVKDWLSQGSSMQIREQNSPEAGTIKSKAAAASVVRKNLTPIERFQN
jgi:hypothetical protein